MPLDRGPAACALVILKRHCLVMSCCGAMRVALTTLGSRGDVQPFVTLGYELRSRGHEVRVAAPADYADIVAEASLDHVPLGGAPSEFLPGKPWDSLGAPDLTEKVRHTTSAVRLSRALHVLPQRPREDPLGLVPAIRTATADADVVVNAILTRPVHLMTGDETPWAGLSGWPHATTGAFPAFGAPRLRLGSTYNRLTYAVRSQLEWRWARRAVNNHRQAAGLAPLGRVSPLRGLGVENPLFHPFSPSIMPPVRDWPENSHMTGFWFWDRPWHPPRDLARFVETGTPPVVLTLGSMWPIHRNFDLLRMVIDSVTACGRRLVFVGEHEDGLPPHVFQIDEVDYSWLFPRSALVIHHGGPGTMGDALRAGVPQVAVPALVDQPFWARRMYEVGVAAAPVPLPGITAENLHASITVALSDVRLKRRAMQLSGYVQADRGVAAAADLLEDWVDSRKSAPAPVARAGS
ncbi:glycosyltransferase [Amycolatopsis sp. WAC 04197]|uniref:glycosyltransferase n=1 Tax=Amycolatopsis sp. WAC 04197 TaxID=2203199 RepID=UPI000F77499A|nr:nucleotide disphospho-sugar-binding domain-containing protein [Amycolatopsis sp. WAC 04197]